MSEALDLLLKSDVENVREKKIKLKRLSTKEIPFVLSIKSLNYNRVAEIKNLTGDDVPIHIMLAGVLDPDLKNQELLNKFNAVTPVEAVKKIFLPGEIEDISREIEKLSGYRVTTIEDIKKK